MALHKQHLVHGPGLIDFESARNGVFEVGDFAAGRFLESSERKMWFERTIFRRFAELFCCERNCRLQCSRTFKIAFETRPKNTRTADVWKCPEIFAD